MKEENKKIFEPQLEKAKPTSGYYFTDDIDTEVRKYIDGCYKDHYINKHCSDETKLREYLMQRQQEWADHKGEKAVFYLQETRNKATGEGTLEVKRVWEGDIDQIMETHTFIAAAQDPGLIMPRLVKDEHLQI